MGIPELTTGTDHPNQSDVTIPQEAQEQRGDSGKGRPETPHTHVGSLPLCLGLSPETTCSQLKNVFGPVPRYV